MKKNIVKIILDLLLAITFVLLMVPRVFDGLPFHEVAGVIIGAAILVHIGLNYCWVINITRKIFNAKLPVKTRFGYLLNVLLLIGMATVIISGIFISRFLFPNLAMEGGRSLHRIHDLSANLTLLLIGVHIGVHWRWIMNVCKRIFKNSEGKLKAEGIVSVLLLLIVLTAIIQWYTSATSPNFGNFNPGFSTPDRNFQGSPNIGFREHRDGFGRYGGESPFFVILRYFVIWAIIIVPSYFFDKKLLSKKA